MDGEPQLGVYEDLITSALEERLSRLIEAHQALIEPLRDDEAPDRLAMHLGSVVRRALERITDTHGAGRGARARAASQIITALLRELADQGDYDVAPDLLTAEPRLLRGIVGVNPDGRPSHLASPITPLLDTTLLTNSKHDQNLTAHLISEIRSASGIDAIIAFIRRSGIAPLRDELAHATNRPGSRFRVLTTTFTRTTEVAALEELAELGAEIRVSYDESATRLHAKAWLFHRPAGSSTGFVGSSNLTYHGNASGLEWNVRLSGRRNPDAVAKLAAAFESCWESEDFVPFDPVEFRERALKPEPDSDVLPNIDVRPYPFQERMLEQLAVARELGRHRNLLVAATGTGKTIMAALDYRRLRPQLPRARLLFVAHRAEILKQSLRTFRMVLGDGAFGELWVGQHRPDRFENVFASIQSLNATGLSWLEPDHFDVVIVDEFHHAAAASYAALLDRLTPTELLGLTATPERADGQSILDLFDGRIAAEMRLWDAIAQQRLVPFQYFALSDGTSLIDIPWRRGRGYDIDALTNVYTADDAWVRLVIQQTRSRADVHTMRALGFCVSVAHAHFVAAHFTRAGIPAVAVSGGTPDAERAKALRDLEQGAVRAVFSVDLFNEGVDIPHVDTLLLLRPTESATLFLQQLGRGLRRAEGKDVCTVLDFISGHRREFRFDLKLRALLGGGTRRDLERNVDQGFPSLPPGASATMDPVARRVILASLQDALPTSTARMVAELKAMLEAGHEPTLGAFLRESGIGSADVYGGNGCFSDLLERAGGLVHTRGPDEPVLRRAIGRLLHIDDMERISTYRRLLAGEPSAALASSERDVRLWRMLVAQLMQSVKNLPTSLAGATELLWAHPQVRAEISQLLDVLSDQVDHEHLRLPGDEDCPLLIHARYARVEIQAALGEGTGPRVPLWREGVKWLPDQGVDAFLVTIDKSEGLFSPTTAYRDFAINRRLFHWESQSRTTPGSLAGQRYQGHEGLGSRVLLFARMIQADRDFWFLGPCTYVSHEGSAPMQIVWSLAHPIPADLFPEMAAVAVA